MLNGRDVPGRENIPSSAALLAAARHEEENRSENDTETYRRRTTNHLRLSVALGCLARLAKSSQRLLEYLITSDCRAS